MTNMISGKYLLVVLIACTLMLFYGCVESDINPSFDFPGERRNYFPMSSNAKIYDISFVDTLHGWVAVLLPSGARNNRSGIFCTSDGGISWFASYLSKAPIIRRVHFIDRQVGWAIGDSGLIIRTSDGGITWQRCLWNISTVQNTKAMSFGRLQFINRLSGWALGYDRNSGKRYIFQTTNGGVDWIKVLESTIPIIDFYMASERIGWITGNYSFDNFGDSFILKTTDNFTSLVPQPNVPVNCGRIYFLRFIDDQVGYAAGYRLLKTTDGGNHWKIIDQYFSAVRDIALCGENTIFIAGGVSPGFDPYSIYRSTNAGINWVKQYTATNYLLSISFINDSTGWAAGAHPTTIYRYRSGHWVKIY